MVNVATSQERESALNQESFLETGCKSEVSVLVFELISVQEIFDKVKFDG